MSQPKLQVFDSHAMPWEDRFIPELGKKKSCTNAKAKRMLGWSPRSNEECVVATAESLVQLGLLKN